MYRFLYRVVSKINITYYAIVSNDGHIYSYIIQFIQITSKYISRSTNLTYIIPYIFKSSNFC